MAQIDEVKKIIREMMDQEMENFKEAISNGESDETASPVVYTMLQVLLAKIEKMQKEHESSNEYLSDEIDYLSKRFPEVSFAKLSRIAVHVSNWQKTIDKVYEPSVSEIRQFCDAAYAKCSHGNKFVLYDFAEMLVRWCFNRQKEE